MRRLLAGLQRRGQGRFVQLTVLCHMLTAQLRSEVSPGGGHPLVITVAFDICTCIGCMTCKFKFQPIKRFIRAHANWLPVVMRERDRLYSCTQPGRAAWARMGVWQLTDYRYVLPTHANE